MAREIFTANLFLVIFFSLRKLLRISCPYKAGSWLHSMSMKTAFPAVCISFYLDGVFKSSAVTFVDNTFVGKERGKRGESVCVALETYLYSLLFFNCPDRCQSRDPHVSGVTFILFL